jgi:DNA-directed RNA polymerase beta subunit
MAEDPKHLTILDEEVWDVASQFFTENGLVSSQIHSYNDFIYSKIHQIIRNLKTTKIEEGEKTYIIELGELIFKSPSLVEKDDSVRILYPVEALQRNISYGSEMYIDIFVTSPTGKTNTYEKVYLGNMPVMVRSDLCNLSSILNDTDKLAEVKEDFYDQGGYFITAPKGDSTIGNVAHRRILVPQEKAAPNKVYTFKNRKQNPKYAFYAEVRSSGHGISHTTTTTIGIVKNTKILNMHITALLPWIDGVEIPLGLLFTALGVVDPVKIATFIIGPDYKNDQDALKIVTYTLEYSYECQSQESALFFIGSKGRKFVKSDEVIDEDLEKDPKDKESEENLIKTREDAVAYATHLLTTEFLPHVKSLDTQVFENKAIYLGYMTRKLIWVILGRHSLVSRDHYMNKRIMTADTLLGQQFYSGMRRLLTELVNNTKKALRNGNSVNILSWLKPTTITNSMYGAISGNMWSSGGPSAKGISQLYEQFNYTSGIANLRKITVPIAAEGGKVIEPRDLHGSHFGTVCPAETPEGKKAGLVKNQALMAYITIGTDPEPLKEICLNILPKFDYPESLKMVKVFVDGSPVGETNKPLKFVEKIKRYRRSAKISLEISIVYFEESKEIHIAADGGRICRPLFIVKNGELVIRLFDIEEIKKGNLTWTQILASGFVELIDKAEEENLLIAGYPSDLEKEHKPNFTHCEIHPSLMYGIGGSIIPFSNHNASPRNCYQCIWKEEEVLMADRTLRKIKDIIVGEKVVTFDPKTLVLSTSKVINHFVRKTDKKIIKISVLGGKSLILTDDHKVMTPDGWMEAGHLTTNDYVMMCMIKSIYNYNTLTRHIADWTKYWESLFNKKVIIPLRITKIEEHENIEIADITIESENHSFIAGGGFCVHNSAMSKQAIGVPFSNYRELMSGSFHTMMYLQRPIALTRGATIIKYDEMPAGQNAIIAVMPRPYNEEDSIEMNQDSIDRGFMVSFKWTCYYAEIREEKGELFYIPTEENCLKFRGNPRHLTPEGFPNPGTTIENNDIIIGKVIENTEDNHKYTNLSIIYDHPWPATVDRIQLGTTGDGYKYIRVMLCQRREPVVGDKFSFMHGQKGTIGMKMRAVDLPFNDDGIAPDIIMNSLALPSRMTIAMLLESLTGKVVISTSPLHKMKAASVVLEIDKLKKYKDTTAKGNSHIGRDFKNMFCRKDKTGAVDATAYIPFDMEILKKEASKYGMDCGDEWLTDGITGNRLRSLVFFSPAFNQRLKHMAVDKMHARARGPMTTLMRQPVEGRALGGGLRYGENCAVVNAKTLKSLRNNAFASQRHSWQHIQIQGTLN